MLAYIHGVFHDLLIYNQGDASIYTWRVSRFINLNNQGDAGIYAMERQPMI